VADGRSALGHHSHRCLHDLDLSNSNPSSPLEGFVVSAMESRPTYYAPHVEAPRTIDLAWLADLLDSRWRIPGTTWRFGLDAVAGLIPGVGDVLSACASLIILDAARKSNVPRHVILRMVGNVALDTVVGSIPAVGRIFDVYFKANRRNLDLFHRHRRL
jgi:hypothetical protein